MSKASDKCLQRKKLKRKDYKIAIESAIIGMHFDWYIDQKWIQKLYGKYFLYSELLNATNIYTAYYGDDFAGLMLVNLRNYPKAYHSLAKSLYVKFFDFLERKSGNEADIYDMTNDMMLERYEKGNVVDGEISFLAANPSLKIKGVGRFLLHCVEQDLQNKKLYLYTDDACNYGFYEHMHFNRDEAESIILKLPKGDIPIDCFFYTKEF